MSKEIFLCAKNFENLYPRLGLSNEGSVSVVEAVAANRIFEKHGVDFTDKEYMDIRRDYFSSCNIDSALSIDESVKISFPQIVRNMFQTKIDHA